jgi:hypothetical protein
MALSTVLVGASPVGDAAIPPDPGVIRESILQSRPFVGLLDLLLYCWKSGVPVVHLQMFPLAQKRMAAACTSVGDRAAILLSKDSMYPASTAFYLAHELGHIALGHLKHNTSIVDIETTSLISSGDDNEEAEADRFALSLLTGQARPVVKPLSGRYNAPALARAVLESGAALNIEPGTLALCFGFSTGNWPVTNSALRFIYKKPKPVWIEVNKLAMRMLELTLVPSDFVRYLHAVLGSTSPE